MPAPRNHPMSQDHAHASFPPLDRIPSSARPAVKDFYAVRDRLRDAEDARRDADKALVAAGLADAAALKKHVTSGGRAADFVTTVTAARLAVEHAKEDIAIISGLVGEAYVKSVYACHAVTAKGETAARSKLDAAAAAYRLQITETELARRRYLDVISEIHFWRFLRETYAANAHLASMDSVNTRHGPMTKVDHGTFVLMGYDAETHERMDAREDLWTTR